MADTRFYRHILNRFAMGRAVLPACFLAMTMVALFLAPGAALAEAPEGARVHEVTATIAVDNEVEGATPALADQAFTFELHDLSGVHVTGWKLGTIDLKAGETKSFSGIPELTYATPGIRTYLVHESAKALGYGWTVPEDVIAIVFVGMNEDGSLQAPQVTYSRPNAESTAALFRNTYEQAAGEFQLALVKTLNGEKPSEGATFTFSATAEGENAGSAPELEDVATDADGAASFRAAHLTDANEGKTYTYRIRQTSDEGPGWTKAPEVIATVTVSERDSENKLAATVAYRQDADGAEAYGGAARFDARRTGGDELKPGPNGSDAHTPQGAPGSDEASSSDKKAAASENSGSGGGVPNTGDAAAPVAGILVAAGLFLAAAVVSMQRS